MEYLFPLRSTLLIEITEFEIDVDEVARVDAGAPPTRGSARGSARAMPTPDLEDGQAPRVSNARRIRLYRSAINNDALEQERYRNLLWLGHWKMPRVP